MSWLDSMAAEAIDDSFLDEAAKVPGTVRFLARISLSSRSPLDFGPVKAAATRRGATRGFLYNIWGKGKILLDSGSAATLTHLRARLNDKKNRVFKRRRPAFATISFVQGLPGSRDVSVRKQGGLDRKILHCHELLRQFRNRSALRQAGNYNPRSRMFDEDE